MSFPLAQVVAFCRPALLAAAAASLVACAGPQAAQPEEFQLSTVELEERFPQKQTIGTVELSGARIQTKPSVREGGGNKYLATGGALLVNKQGHSILGKAAEILVISETAELTGGAVVKKDGRLFIAEGDSTKIIIDGSEVRVEGPHSIKRAAKAESLKVASVTTSKPVSDIPEPQESKPIAAPEPEVKLAKETPSTASSPAKPAPVIKPKQVPEPVKVAAVAPTPKKLETKVSSPPPAKPTSADRSQLLNLMREPQD